MLLIMAFTSSSVIQVAPFVNSFLEKFTNTAFNIIDDFISAFFIRQNKFSGYPYIVLAVQRQIPQSELLFPGNLY